MSTNSQTDLKICIEIKRIKQDKANFKKKDKVELILCYFKIHCQTGNQTVVMVYSRIKSPEIDPPFYYQLINQSNPKRKDRIFQHMELKQLVIYLGARR